MTDAFNAYKAEQVATYLSGERLKSLLVQMMGTTKDDDWRAQLDKAVRMIDAGEARRDSLLKLLDPW